MKIKTYAIKTIKEPKALYVKLADKIIDFTESTDEVPEFLNVEKLIAVAKENKIQAIHPGYGFLSENPYFAQRCKEEGIIFIGPTAEVIYKMGNKTIAKEIAAKHKIPMIAGSKGSVKNVEEAKKIARKIGYPIILKAASGGGGKGMRIVEEESLLEKYFNIASSEAEKSFNDSSIFIERYVKNPKHIEFQILADNFGNVIHLGERDCSIQRKHQKLIEQSPSAALTESLRGEMGAEAIKIAKAVGYNSAGTVEFLLDENLNYYFIEMNTRIQVEHPVTEMVTNIDLIEQQILIAENKKLKIKQSDVEIDGWAIEFRINAEDAQSNFSPNTGVVEHLHYPKDNNIRVDSGLENGSVITPYFDSMVAKLIVKGKTRDEMIELSKKALDEFIVKGVKTSIPFHRKVLRTKAFIDGSFTTSFIANDLDSTFYFTHEEELVAAFLATNHFAKEIKTETNKEIDFESGKQLSPWILNKRLK